MGETSAVIGEGINAAARPWWESRALVVFAVLAAFIPLLYPAIPPLVDLLGHMGRYRVELDLGHSPWLQRYFNFHWAAIGNLGVDLLVMGLGRIIGLEPAVKLIVLMIPPLTVAGFLWVAREVHGRIPPTAYFAIPFAFGHPFLFGFVNFALSMALAFLAFGLWLRLGRQGRTRLRAALFVPISLIVFFAHAYGWGALGLLCFSAEAVRQHDRGIGWFRAGVNAAVQASVMALPLLIMIIWRSEAHGGTTGDWFNWSAKLIWLKTALRDRWQLFDIASVAVVGLVLMEALRNPRLTFSRNLAFSGLVLVACFVILPRIIFGSAYADMRLVPYFIAVLLLAIRFRDDTVRKLGHALAVLAVAFVAIRIGANTVSLARASNDQQAKLQALAHVPVGARVISFIPLQCGIDWALPRDSHLGAMVIVRRDGFSNDQWMMEGLNLLDLKYTAPGRFASDPSNIVRPDRCPERLHLTIDPPPFDAKLVAGLQPVWRGADSILYRLYP